MQKTYSEHDSQEYTFDPSSIVKIISENPQIGLALIQLPISIANSLMRSYHNLKWKDNPTVPGYYWVKSSNETISIKEYSSKDINYIIDTSLKSLLKFYGPLEPPE